MFGTRLCWRGRDRTARTSDGDVDRRGNVELVAHVLALVVAELPLGVGLRDHHIIVLAVRRLSARRSDTRA